MSHKKRQSLPTPDKTACESDLFDGLPDDLVINILCKLTSSASSPSDLINFLLTCKRLNCLGLHPVVLSNAGPQVFAIKAKNWSDSAHRFLKLCVNAGSIEACYTLGMIRFYCLRNTRSGASLMAKAAIRSHAPSLYSVAVIQFNGSGGSNSDKDPRAGFALCARAAFLGNIDALRELGHCLQDGFGVRQNVKEGHCLLIQANIRELASLLRLSSRTSPPEQNRINSDIKVSGESCRLLASEIHPVHRFLREWFERSQELQGEGLRLCANNCCGRPETRRNEFRQCSVCGKVNYCSRGCQTLDWKSGHKSECSPF